MNRIELERMIAKYDQKAEKAYRDYQETGITRYNTARRNAEDLADALRMALAAEADHNKLIHYRALISAWASRAGHTKCTDAQQADAAAASLLAEIRSVATSDGLLREVPR